MIDALWNHPRGRSHPPRFTGCTIHNSTWGSDCTYTSTTLGLALTMQVKGGALLGWHVEAITFTQM